MTQTPTETGGSGKGQAFFDRADEVAETGNWDFAIELYLEGISREPDNIERGHQPLRNVALKRKAQGGKGPGMIEKARRGGGKEPLDALINAEYLLSKEPGSATHLFKMLKAAQELDLHDLALWACDLLLEMQKQAQKHNKKILLALTEAYHDIEEYGKAIQALQMAIELAPSDGELAAAMQDLSAKYTIKKGRYSEEGDFTKSVKDMDRQKELMQRDAMVKGADYLNQQVEQARREYLEDPAQPGKINAYVDALLKLEDPAYENEAVDVLDKAYQDTGAYQFAMRKGDIRIAQFSRRSRKLLAGGDKDAAQKALREQLEFELKEYAERVKHYPTDVALKYELGRRHFMAGNYDDAIGMLQQAQRDPRRRIRALSYLGQAFARKGWRQEAAETSERALEEELGEDAAKEIRYNLAEVYEQMDRLREAEEQYSDVAQMDYNYKDVRQRLEKVRKRIAEQKGGEPQQG